jgi:hypothetical protein
LESIRGKGTGGQVTNHINIILYKDGIKVKQFQNVWGAMEWFNAVYGVSLFFAMNKLNYSIKEVIGEEVKQNEYNM